VITAFRNWIEHRTGISKLINLMLLEHIPGGAKWRYVWGSALAFVFTVQMVTGILLMTAYSPSDTTAWSSVYYIQYEMDFGWLIRGLHHFGSQMMVILLGVHMLQVVIAGAQLKPREINWWLGLGLMGVVLALSLTGYLLPWDQKGYWATQVATNIAGGLPGIGPWLRKVIVGGPEYGNHTLTRFFALHVAILPGLLIVLVIAHLAVFRRHGITHPPKAQGEGWFWPDQAFKDMVISMIIFGLMLGLVIWGWGSKQEQKNADGTKIERTTYDKIAHAGKDGRGANLDSPADPDRPYPARPEWYFLFLFQLLKYFEGNKVLIGTVIIPNGVIFLLALLPLFGYGRMRKFGHIAGVVVVASVLLGAAVLTMLAVAEDRGSSEKAKTFRDEVEHADKLASRSIDLAAQGIPEAGPRYLLRRDPKTQGIDLFKVNCASCHTCGDDCKNDKPTAGDLSNFGSKEWVKGILTEPDNARFLGATHLKGGKMVAWVKARQAEAAKNEKRKQSWEEDVELISEWLSQAPRGEPKDPARKSAYEKGLDAFKNRCAECHTYDDPTGEAADGPDLTGFGDADYLRNMIVNPHGAKRYGKNNRMPIFRNLEGPLGGFAKEQVIQETKDVGDEARKLNHLSDIDRELIIRWLLKDYRVVFGGDAISTPPKK
jgi:ubiquinol-cytochrome c reductase cytochrome b subunit